MTAPLEVPRHIGIVTSDLDSAMTTLAGQFGLEWNEPSDVSQRFRHRGLATDSQLTVVHSTAGPMRVELLHGSPGSIWHTDRRAELHHYAYTTPALERDCVLLAEDGWELELTVDDDGGRPRDFAYLVKPRRPRIELIQTAPRPGDAVLPATDGHI